MTANHTPSDPNCRTRSPTSQAATGEHQVLLAVDGISEKRVAAARSATSPTRDFGSGTAFATCGWRKNGATWGSWLGPGVRLNKIGDQKGHAVMAIY